MAPTMIYNQFTYCSFLHTMKMVRYRNGSSLWVSFCTFCHSSGSQRTCLLFPCISSLLLIFPESDLSVLIPFFLSTLKHFAFRMYFPYLPFIFKSYALITSALLKFSIFFKQNLIPDKFEIAY